MKTPRRYKDKKQRKKWMNEKKGNMEGGGGINDNTIHHAFRQNLVCTVNVGLAHVCCNINFLLGSLT